MPWSDQAAPASRSQDARVVVVTIQVTRHPVAVHRDRRLRQRALTIRAAVTPSQVAGLSVAHCCRTRALHRIGDKAISAPATRRHSGSSGHRQHLQPLPAPGHRRGVAHQRAPRPLSTPPWWVQAGGPGRGSGNLVRPRFRPWAFRPARMPPGPSMEGPPHRWRGVHHDHRTASRCGCAGSGGSWHRPMQRRRQRRRLRSQARSDGRQPALANGIRIGGHRRRGLLTVAGLASPSVPSAGAIRRAVRGALVG